MSTPGCKRLLGVNLLLVEDAIELRELCRSMLEMEGATVSEAGSAREAFELARTQTFDLVLTDLGLPDMPGEAVIARVRAVSRGRTPVAVVSGSDPGRLAHALQVGAERAFAKPVDWEDLVRYLIRRTAGGARPSITTVLLVEDDQTMRALLRDVMEKAGHRVIERPDGADLPALTDSGSFDIVVLDNMLPGANGLDLLSFIRGRRPAVPVILATAFGGPTVAADAMRRGAYRYIEKPFRLDEMLAALAEAPVIEHGSGHRHPA